MAQTRFFRTTKGFNAEVVVALAVAYTTDATYADFVANAVNGEIGVFNADTLALVTAELAEGDKYFIAQKRGEEVKTTTTSIYQSGTITKTDYVAPVKQVSRVTFAGTIGTDYAVGDEITVAVIETTPGSEPYPRIDYSYTVKAADTPTLIAAGLAAKINSQTALENIDGQAFTTATSTGANLDITAKFFGSAFKVALPGKSYEIATTSITTPYKQGSGYPEVVSRDEVEGQIFEGVTTQYPMDGFSPLDFGTPGSFTDTTKTYNTFNFNVIRNEKSPTPINLHHHSYNLILHVPVTGGPDVALTTVFGFDPEV